MSGARYLLKVATTGVLIAVCTVACGAALLVGRALRIGRKRQP